jgi:hypothetical protein
MDFWRAMKGTPYPPFLGCPPDRIKPRDALERDQGAHEDQSSSALPREAAPEVVGQRRDGPSLTAIV